MSDEIKMSDTWGWGCVPQDYTKFNGFKHDNGDYNGDCYGLIFLTEDAAEAQAHALRNHDRLAEENKRLRDALDLASNSISRMLDADQCDGDAREFINARNQGFCAAGIINNLLSELGGD